MGEIRCAISVNEATSSSDFTAAPAHFLASGVREGGRRLRYVAGEEEEDVAFFVGLHAQKRARLPPVMFEFKTTPPPLSLHLTDARSRKR